MALFSFNARLLQKYHIFLLIYILLLTSSFLLLLFSLQNLTFYTFWHLVIFIFFFLVDDFYIENSLRHDFIGRFPTSSESETTMPGIKYL